MADKIENAVETVVVPEVPKVIPDEQIYVYVPIATETSEGILRATTPDFTIVDGKLKLLDGDGSKLKAIKDSVGALKTEVNESIKDLQGDTDTSIAALQQATEQSIGALQDSKQDKTDASLTTTNKTVVGAINENKAAADNLDRALTDTNSSLDVTNRALSDTNDFMRDVNNKVIALENAGFITKAVNDLLNYYLKADVYTKDQVNQLLQNLQKAAFKIVQELPETGETNIIYLLSKTETTDDNVYDEYVYINNTWERIGSTSVNLDDYYTKNEVDEAVDSSRFKNLGTFSIAVEDWEPLLDSDPFTVTAVKTVTLSEVIDADRPLLFSYNDVIASAGVAVKSARGSSTLTVTFIAVMAPTTIITGTIGGTQLGNTRTDDELGLDDIASLPVNDSIEYVAYTNNIADIQGYSAIRRLGETNPSFILNTGIKIPIKAADGLSIGVDETGKFLTIKLDQTVLNSIDSKIPKKTTTTNANALVGFDSTNNVQYLGIGDGLSIEGNTLKAVGGGGGSGDLHTYNITLIDSNGEYVLNMTISSEVDIVDIDSLIKAFDNARALQPDSVIVGFYDNINTVNTRIVKIDNILEDGTIYINIIADGTTITLEEMQIISIQ